MTTRPLVTLGDRVTINDPESRYQGEVGSLIHVFEDHFGVVWGQVRLPYKSPVEVLVKVRLLRGVEP